MSTSKSIPTLVLVASLLLAPPALGQTDDASAALAVAEQILESINTKNAEMMRGLMFEDALTHSMVIQQGIPVRTARGRAEMVGMLENATAEFDERMFEPHVVVAGGMATIVGYYEFRVNGELSHCGHDTFILMKDRAGDWKISGLSYTVMPIGQDACNRLRESDGI